MFHLIFPAKKYLLCTSTPHPFHHHHVKRKKLSINFKYKNHINKKHCNNKKVAVSSAVSLLSEIDIRSEQKLYLKIICKTSVLVVRPFFKFK